MKDGSSRFESGDFIDYMIPLSSVANGAGLQAVPSNDDYEDEGEQNHLHGSIQNHNGSAMLNIGSNQEEDETLRA